MSEVAPGVGVGGTKISLDLFAREGGEHHVELSVATAEHRIRASFTDPFGNRRHIERGEWLERNARPPFLRHTQSS